MNNSTTFGAKLSDLTCFSALGRVAHMGALSLIVLLSACATTAGDGVTIKGTEKRYATIEEAEAEADDDDLICRREDVLGTHFPRTVCMTKSQRRQAREEAQRGMIQNRAPASQPRLN